MHPKRQCIPAFHGLRTQVFKQRTVYQYRIEIEYDGDGDGDGDPGAKEITSNIFVIEKGPFLLVLLKSFIYLMIARSF